MMRAEKSVVGELAALRGENAALRGENAALTDTNRRLKKSVDTEASRFINETCAHPACSAGSGRLAAVGAAKPTAARLLSSSISSWQL